MAIVTEFSPRIVRSYARPLPPVREPRRTPRPAAPFGDGILPEPLAPIALAVKALGQGSVGLLQWPGRFVVVFTPHGGGPETREEHRTLASAQARYRELTRHTPDDEAWWRANSPTSRCGYYVEGAYDPSDPFNWSMPAADYQHEEMTPARADHADFGCQYLSHAEGGAE